MNASAAPARELPPGEIPRRALHYMNRRMNVPVWMRLALGRDPSPSKAEWAQMVGALMEGDPAMDRCVEWMFAHGARDARPLFYRALENGIASASVPPCSSCHGPEGHGKDTFPRLAGQQRPYLERQLAAFISNARANEIMHANAKDLTALQISQIAAFLSGQQ